LRAEFRARSPDFPVKSRGFTEFQALGTPRCVVSARNFKYHTRYVNHGKCVDFSACGCSNQSVRRAEESASNSVPEGRRLVVVGRSRWRSDRCRSRRGAGQAARHPG
jgi:hypothetical protein